MRKLVACLVAVIATTAANAAVITFTSIPGGNGASFTTYSEAGFTVTNNANAYVVAQAYGNPIPDIFTSYPNGNSSSITVTAQGGGQFTFQGVDLSTGSGQSNYVITGLLGGITQYTLSGGPYGFPTWTTTIGSPLIIDTLVIQQNRVSGATANIDNIQVTAVVPEPVSMMVFGSLVVGGIVAVRRRMTKAAA